MNQSGCNLTYSTNFTYINYVLSFLVTITALRLFHESMHAVFSYVSGGTVGNIYIAQWVLFYPIFAINTSGGNLVLNLEGTLMVTWVASLLVVMLCSYPFLRTLYDDCRAANLSGKLWGIKLGAIFEMFGTAVYALPNIVFPMNGFSEILGGDGYTLGYIFQTIGYSIQYQYFIAILLMVGSFFTLYWAIRCDPRICGCAYGGAT